MIRATIIDDHQLFAEGVQQLLKDASGIRIDTSYRSFEHFTEVDDLANYEVLLLDINLDGENGIDVCSKIRAMDQNIKIIALTMINDLSVIREMINSGANGYLLKNVDKSELEKAIRKVSSGEQYLGRSTSQIAYDQVFRSRKKQRRKLLPSISRREKQVLELIVQEFTTQEIADTLFISFSTVETHRRNLSIKLGARNSAGLVRIAIENGLVGYTGD
jgi:DNA-binding NarL/FixJ family response regulator